MERLLIAIKTIVTLMTVLAAPAALLYKGMVIESAVLTIFIILFIALKAWIINQENNSRLLALRISANGTIVVCNYIYSKLVPSTPEGITKIEFRNSVILIENMLCCFPNALYYNDVKDLIEKLKMTTDCDETFLNETRKEVVAIIDNVMEAAFKQK